MSAEVGVREVYRLARQLPRQHQEALVWGLLIANTTSEEQRRAVWLALPPDVRERVAAEILRRKEVSDDT